ncbi:MAG: glutamine synthetase III [Bdellovibrionales bacterium]|nr:glutamine synthetase III [Bdellovibrionales bacterium]
MISLRQQAVLAALNRDTRKFERPKDALGKPLAISEFFGGYTFGLSQIKEKLSKESYDVLVTSVQKGDPLPKEVADDAANVIKDWGMSQGATHFCHWFQPMTGLTAEKHDAFIQSRTSETGQTIVIEKFSGLSLIQSEPDASSFPSGGMRTTFEARGYTAWDPTSPIFLMESVNGKTMCIPSAFTSYHGQALDIKTPLLRSIEALSKQAVQFLKLIGDIDITSVHATLGAEQEYFLVDRALFATRPDLLMTGRTLVGRASTRGQQFEDHYFGSIPSRVLAFMHELEQELYRLGVPIKTRHNEVAPGQFEVAPIFESAELSSDHNALLMDLLPKIALRHHFACLLHEKPFAGINGSGKHNNWSLSSQKGDNLLEPGRTPHQNLRFLAVLATVLKAVFENQEILRLAIASAGNDHRLGANEAPPAIMSVFLGQNLNEILEQIETGKDIESKTESLLIKLGASKLAVIAKDNTDRNRTSPFAFTGNKFEFRAVGSSANIAFPVSILNASVAQAFEDMTKKLEKKIQSGEKRDDAVLSLVKEVITETKMIRFEGNNYALDWTTEATKRGLKNLRTTPEVLAAVNNESCFQFLIQQNVLSKDEYVARYNIILERYIKQIEMEAHTLLEIIDTHVFASLESELSRLVTSNCHQGPRGLKAKKLYGDLSQAKEDLEKEFTKTLDEHDELKKAHLLSDKVLFNMQKVRNLADDVEGFVSDQTWTLPKYRELLFIR